MTVLTILALTAALTMQGERFDALGKTIPELQQAMERGDATSVDLVRQYLERIEAFDNRGPRLNSMVYLNPRALDRERAEKGPRGPLHGIPMILKDNYDTHDMPTSAGSVALAGFVPADDGYQVAKLREAGVVFLGKSNMHELARGITTISSIGGQTRNPYDPRRNPGGSSGGTGAAIGAELAAIGMGSDTCGSIRIPAANNNLFGLRVTQGLSSHDGIVPLAHTQDVGGPLARSVVDLVLVLDATVGPDPNDSQTAGAKGKIPETYTAFLDENALSGKRLGLLTSYLSEEGPLREVTEVVLSAATQMESQGAVLVEIEIEELGDLLEGSGVIVMEFKFDFRDYLAAAEAPPIRNIGEILERGLYHKALGSRFASSNEVEEGSDEYVQALAKRKDVERALVEAFEAHELDAIVYPTLRTKPAIIGERQFSSSCSIAAHSGLPAFSLPAGFTTDGVPVGIELLGKKFGEAELIAMAYAYEQNAKPRRVPERTPSLVSGNSSIDFLFAGEAIRGKARLNHPTQTFHYEIELPGLLDHELIDVKIHRGARGESGAIIAQLGTGRSGTVAIGNEDLEALKQGRLYTTRAPRGADRAQIEPLR
jgi:Asp-tRNA(Asn)/Glu-tRNA(Gln) amidotransferase A subunit family amidase